MTSKWLFSGALAFELGSWSALIGDPTLVEALYLYILPHAAGSALLAAGLWLLLPRRYKFPLPWSPLLLFSFIFFIPLVGVVGTVGGIFAGLYLPRRATEQGWQATRMPALPFRAVEQRNSPLFHDGGLQDVLQLASDPEQRMAALLATKRMPGNEAAPILKLALRDPEDDVRLLAYSMLDQQETAINQNIERLQLRLAEQPRAPKAAHAALARWYWELAYLGLAQGGVLEHILAQALLHTQAAMEGGDNADLDLLAGRILMAQGQVEEARERLQHTVELGMNTSRVAPFLAEIAFMEQRYSDVALYLNAIPETLRNKPPLATAARYWL